jgi:hypothetical protein
VTSEGLDLEWSWAGEAPSGFTITVNGTTVARNVQGAGTRIDLKPFPDGPIRLVVNAEGAKMRSVLSYDREALPLGKSIPASCEVDFTLRRNR